MIKFNLPKLVKHTVEEASMHSRTHAFTSLTSSCRITVQPFRPLIFLRLIKTEIGLFTHLLLRRNDEVRLYLVLLQLLVTLAPAALLHLELPAQLVQRGRRDMNSASGTKKIKKSRRGYDWSFKMPDKSNFCPSLKRHATKIWFGHFMAFLDLDDNSFLRAVLAILNIQIIRNSQIYFIYLSKFSFEILPSFGLFLNCFCKILGP